MSSKALQPEPIGHKLLPPGAHLSWTLSATDGLTGASVCDHDGPRRIQTAHAVDADGNDLIHGTFPVSVQDSGDHEPLSDPKASFQGKSNARFFSFNAYHYLEESEKNMCEAIDAVVTWVDSSCPTWQSMRYVYAREEADCLFTPPETPDAEVDLCISLLLRHLPWLRCIWLVTMRPQKPKCLSRPEFEGRVKLVHHDEIMEVSSLPTFNSRAIEGNLWKIPNLSERFIYLNDDFYVLRPVSQDDFFNSNKPIAWVSKPVPLKWQHDPHFYKFSWYSLSSSLAGLRLLHHAPFGLTKTMFADAAKYFEDPWSRTCASRVKTSKTIPTIGAAINLAIRNDSVVVAKVPRTLFKEAVMKPKTVTALLKKDAYFLCVNRQPFDKTQAFCDEMRAQLHLDGDRDSLERRDFDAAGWTRTSKPSETLV